MVRHGTAQGNSLDPFAAPPPPPHHHLMHSSLGRSKPLPRLPFPLSSPLPSPHPLLDPCFCLQANIWDGRRQSTAVAYLPPPSRGVTGMCPDRFRRTDTLTVSCLSYVTKVDIVDGRATGVRYAGWPLHVRAGEGVGGVGVVRVCGLLLDWLIDLGGGGMVGRMPAPLFACSLSYGTTRVVRTGVARVDAKAPLTMFLLSTMRDGLCFRTYTHGHYPCRLRRGSLDLSVLRSAPEEVVRAKREVIVCAGRGSLCVLGGGGEGRSRCQFTLPMSACT